MQTITHGKWTVGLSLLLAFAFAGTAAAVSPNVRAQEAENRRNNTQQVVQQTDRSGRQNGEEKRLNAAAKLEDAQLKACQKREQNINKILQRIATRSEKQLDVFTKISERTQAFYETKGRTLDNYDQLVETVNTEKAEAEAAVQAVKDRSTEFACDGTDPKGVASLFKEDLKSQIAALKEYKQAVKDLIVGVKSVQGATSSGDNAAEETTVTPEGSQE